MSLSAGLSLGPYEIVAPLGAGGMGEVWLARDARLSREVAIKVLPAEVASDPGRLRRFEKEAQAASALNHPNIVTIYEVGTWNGAPWIAMEQVQGKTLRELLFAGAMPVKRLLSIASQITDGLARAHEAGIVHRDLKPENVMVTKDGLIKILDFGLAKRTSGSGSDEGSHLPTETGTSPGMIVGTVGYMSPEQAAGSAVDFRSDQFAVGSILYEMATGKRAFQKKTGVETLTAILNEEPEPVGVVNPQAPAPLRWIVERCLAKAPDERYASTLDLARDLANVRDHLSEATSSGALVSRASSPTRARFRNIAAFSAVGVALAAVYLFGHRAGTAGRPSSTPSFHRLTFRRGVLGNACFTPDGRTVVYSADWKGGDRQIYSTRLDSPESRPLGFGNADIVAVSSAGEMAIVLHSAKGQPIGTLARVSLSGGAPREVLENVNMLNADWSPDGKNLVVVRSVDGKNRLEFPIGKVLLETNALLFKPRFAPHGDRIAFFEGADLTVVETAGEKKKILTSGLEDDGGLPCWTPDGDEIWFTASESGQLPALYAVNLSGKQRLVTRVPGGLELHDISREGRVLLEHHTNLAILRGATAGESTDRDLSWLDGSSPSDLSADGRVLAITEILEGGGPNNAIYLRKTDGSPAKRLGDGQGMTISPDGKWLLSSSPSAQPIPPRLVLLPTAAGESKTLEYKGFENIDWANWLPDGKRILLSANESARRTRIFVQEISGSNPRAITPDGVGLRPFGNSVSPDGRLVIGVAGRWLGGQWSLYPVDGGDPRPIRGLEPQDIPIQWSADGRSLFVFRRHETRPRVWLVDWETGRRRLWKEIRTPDPTSDWIHEMLVSPGGGSYVYLCPGLLSELYLVDGLK